MDLIPHLFRTESGKITTVLCRLFGMEYMELAEDITSDTFLTAMETWPYQGVPPNPTAWLYTVAKNKAINHFTRDKIFREKILPTIHANKNSEVEFNIDFTGDHIKDSQLRMLFAVCNPVIPSESQIALALRILCGFGIDEIANAFLTNRELIYKRIFRAKEKLREENIIIDEWPVSGISERTTSVLHTLYLLFNEGYYSESDEQIIREDLCFEAMRLLHLLIDNEKTNTAEANALMALMCFHTSRFAARKDAAGNMVLYADQDESLWNQELIAKGVFYFQQSSGGDRLSPFHFEAAIACWHTNKTDSREKWESILDLYNRLLKMKYSPVAALNRSYAIFKLRGAEQAIMETEKLKLDTNQYYFLLLGELYRDIDRDTSIHHFKKAISLAKTDAEKKSIQRRVES
ncbi:RNA polymerase sigma factor [Pollutibacter soli]|uniref:RNA polymerase sigma factor n=1 Tax=Pollutibacter soli TaxID=3034157 RepID=UPI003013583A